MQNSKINQSNTYCAGTIPLQMVYQRRRSYTPSRTYRAPRRTYVSRSRITGIPRLPSSIRSMLTAARYNLDSKPLVFRYASTFAINTVQPDGFASKTQPLYDFVNSTFYTAGVALQYNQYRLKRAVYTLRLLSARTADAPNFDLYSCGQVFAAFDRSDIYANTSVLQFDKIANYPDCRRAVLDGTRSFELRNSITAQSYGDEAGWLSTDAIPGVAPNTDSYFCPALYLGVQSDVDNIKNNVYMVDVEFIIDVRG